MGFFAQDMTNLGKELLHSFEERMGFVKGNFNNTRQMLGQFRNEQKKMGNELRKDLGNFVCDLTENVQTLRTGFRNFLKQEHNENKKAHQAWVNCTKEMAKIRNHPHFSSKKSTRKGKK